MSDLEQQAASWVPPWQRPAGPSTPDASPDATSDSDVSDSGAFDEIDEEIPTSEPWCELDDSDDSQDLPEPALAAAGDPDTDLDLAAPEVNASGSTLAGEAAAEAVTGHGQEDVSGVVAGLPRQADARPLHSDAAPKQGAAPESAAPADVAMQAGTLEAEPGDDAASAAEVVGGQADSAIAPATGEAGPVPGEAGPVPGEAGPVPGNGDPAVGEAGPADPVPGEAGRAAGVADAGGGKADLADAGAGVAEHDLVAGSAGAGDAGGRDGGAEAAGGAADAVAGTGAEALSGAAAAGEGGAKGAAKKGRRPAKGVIEAPLPESVFVPGQRESDESTADIVPLAAVAPEDLAPTLEAILMVVDEPASEIMLSQVLDVPAEDIASALIELSASYTREGRGFDLRRAAGGWRFYTRADYSSYVERFVLDGQQLRLTQASLETLAVVAYRQPVTRSRISAIRGVNCDGVIRTLVTRGMVEECGADPDSGAHLYRTTNLFLEKLGLDSVEQLPPIAPFLPDNLDEMEAV